MSPQPALGLGVGAWPFGVCGLLANGCCEGRGQWRGGSEEVPSAFRVFPPQAGLIRSRRALVLSGSLGCGSESHQARPFAHRFRTPGSPARQAGTLYPIHFFLIAAPESSLLLKQDAVGFPADRL